MYDDFMVCAKSYWYKIDSYAGMKNDQKNLITTTTFIIKEIMILFMTTECKLHSSSKCKFTIIYGYLL